MLPKSARLHRSADFTEVVRRGRRASRRTLTVHLLTAPPVADTAVPGDGPPATRSSATRSSVRAGLVVGKAVGGSVVRSTVSRRLRHLLQDRLAGLPSGARVVVRAAPPAAGASSTELGGDLDAALARALQPGAGRRSR